VSNNSDLRIPIQHARDLVSVGTVIPAGWPSRWRSPGAPERRRGQPGFSIPVDVRVRFRHIDETLGMVAPVRTVP
jgi:hypothetical protein